jgi:DNA-binding YbaB/EbfC family protein
MADFMKMLQQAQQMQGRLQQLQEELDKLVITASSGGGMVTVTADGKGIVHGITIDPSVAGGADVEMLEDLVLAAVTEAQRKAAAAAKSEMEKATGGLALPPGFKLPL